MNTETILAYAPVVVALLALVLALVALYQISRIKSAAKDFPRGGGASITPLGSVTQQKFGELKGDVSRLETRIGALETAAGPRGHQRADVRPTDRPSVKSVDPRSVPAPQHPPAGSASAKPAAPPPPAKPSFESHTFYLKFDQNGVWPEALISTAPGENFYFRAETTSETTASLRLIRNSSAFEMLMSRPKEFASPALKVKSTGGSNLVDEQPGRISRVSNGTWTVAEPVVITVG